MANEEQVKLLKQGVALWNIWRQEHPDVLPDLSGAHFNHADLNHANLSNTNLSYIGFVRSDLSSANLQNANLEGANLISANLVDANLSGADLSNTQLSFANLSLVTLNGANLNSADLVHTDLSRANLGQANLGRANLKYTNLSGANLRDANFSAARLDATIFAWVDLSTVEGLDAIVHYGPSSVDVKTVKFPEGKTRLHFLQGVGFSDAFIDYLPSLFTSAIQYASCFISYAHQDEALAQRLYKNLQEKGVRCWFAPEEMKIGDRIRARIDQAIQVQEKLLLLLSEHSLASSWVEMEVEAALEKEQRQGCDVLFPVRLDNAVIDTVQAWAATLRRTRHIGNFYNWKEPQAYQQAFNRLLRDLKAQT